MKDQHKDAAKSTENKDPKKSAETLETGDLKKVRGGSSLGNGSSMSNSVGASMTVSGSASGSANGESYGASTERSVDFGANQDSSNTSF